MFVEVNCAAIPEDLIESELFGHRAGAFPGAVSDKEGKFQKADGGTLFLDEVGDMSLKTQSKVLRTLDEGRFAPVGEEEAITVDARVIAATNKDLEDEISKGNFREDLFYRLNVIPFYVPPLRERKEDIPLLAQAFPEGVFADLQPPSQGIAEDAVDALVRYTWPGNVRELRNLIERIVIMNPDGAASWNASTCPPLIYREGGRRSLGEFSSLHEARAAYRARLHPQEARRKPRQREPHRRSAGPGAQPPVPQDEDSGDCGEGRKLRGRVSLIAARHYHRD